MVVFHRLLDLQKESRSGSLFLFGPRQTGKTFLLRRTFSGSPYYDLLHAEVFLRLSRRPQTLREELAAKRTHTRGPVIIDEIQKLPLLLDEVHAIIEETGARFILTGSSTRKLRRGGANLLGGRARTCTLFPLVSREVPGFDLLRALTVGTIPSIYLSEEPEKDLAAYCGSYLQEEVQAEGLVRRIDNFSRFLQMAAVVNTELINFESVASDAAVPARTVREYFTILNDTLVGTLLEPYAKSRKRKMVSTAKFYFFDVGVCNHLAERKILSPRSELFGKVLEHFIFTEIRAFLSYTGDGRKLSFWRTREGDEVDFLLGDETAVEVKASREVTSRHTSGLRCLAGEMKTKNRIVVSMDPSPRMMEGVTILPVGHFLERLWNGEF
jgi:predicted AAA+ superfamily ATPase